MAFVLEDRVVETANNPGQGDFELLGATMNNRTFVAAIGNGNTTRYLAVGAEGWEIGVAQVSAGSPDRLLRPGTVTKNSDGGTSPISFTGTVTVACVASVEDVFNAALLTGIIPPELLQGAYEMLSLSLKGTSSNPLVLERPDSAINVSARYTTSAGSVYAGTADGTDFAVGPGNNLLSNRWLRSHAGGLEVLGRAAYHRGNIVGAVAQSGGEPSGSIIEQGSGANGVYIRFADGTQICARTMSGLGPANQTFGSVFASSDYLWTYPAAFSAKPTVLVQGSRNVSSITQPAVWASAAYVTQSAMRFWLVASSSSSSTIMEAELLAIGRWY